MALREKRRLEHLEKMRAKEAENAKEKARLEHMAKMRAKAAQSKTGGVTIKYIFFPKKMLSFQNLRTET